ncbi:MAG: preprotein translocase subunit YajC [Clostridia bacterium]|nr:preprotein translocase subunit YajC [Clostridia bacterium]
MNLFGIVAYATENGAQQPPSGPAAIISSFLPLVLMIAVFYFLLIRPQRKRDKEKRAMLDALKVGDKVVTIGGICGKVSKIKDNYVFIETGNIGTEDQKSVIKMERSSINTVEQKVKN